MAQLMAIYEDPNGWRSKRFYPLILIPLSAALLLLSEGQWFNTAVLLDQKGAVLPSRYSEDAFYRVATTLLARYLAAHSPTERARLQTAMVARRLSRGESIHEALDEEEPQSVSPGGQVTRTSTL
jgi:hypothetical protein